MHRVEEVFTARPTCYKAGESSNLTLHSLLESHTYAP